MLFEGIRPGSLGDALELGGGDGFVASLVEPYCRSLLTTDSFAREPAPGTDCLARLVCDATDLPFGHASFDLLFSSSVLEHIADRRPVYAEMARCLRSDGVMVHVMPSRTWKLLQLVLYYPHLVVGAVDLALDWMLGRLPHARKAAAQGRWCDAERVPSWRRILRGLLPQVHGEYAGHLEEWIGFSRRAWTREFTDHGFVVRRMVGLPLYSGYGFGFDGLRALGERLGLSSHTAFVLTRRGNHRQPWD